MNIYEILDEIEQAYPVDIFPDTTAGEREDVIERYPGFIDRTSAMMGRHLATVIRRKLAEGEEDRLYKTAQALMSYMKKSAIPKLPPLPIPISKTPGLDRWISVNDYGELFATKNFDDVVPVWRKYRRLGWALRYTGQTLSPMERQALNKYLRKMYRFSPSGTSIFS